MICIVKGTFAMKVTGADRAACEDYANGIVGTMPDVIDHDITDIQEQPPEIGGLNEY